MKGHVRACGGADWSARSVGVLCEDWSRWRHKGAWERLNATAGLRRCICIIIHSVCVGGGGVGATVDPVFCSFSSHVSMATPAVSMRGTQMLLCVYGDGTKPKPPPTADN